MNDANTFKRGDRVIATRDDGYLKPGDIGTIMNDSSNVPNVRWDKDKRTYAECAYALKFLHEIQGNYQIY